MPAWNPSRSPGTFPAAWHEAIRRPPGRHTIAVLPQAQFKNYSLRWRLFTATLRAHPFHPTATAYGQKVFRLEGTAREDGEVLVEVVSRWALATMLAMESSG